MPNRILREGILTSEAVDSLSNPAEVFYRRLMSVIDDFGRYYAKPSLLRAACYPLRLDKVTDMDVVKFLAELCNTKPCPLALVYEVEGKQFLQLLKFRQQVRAKKSKFPDPPSHAAQMHSERIADAHLDGGGGGDVVEDEDGGDKGENRSTVSTSACPHQEIIALYHEHLPMGRQVNPRLWKGTRAKHLQARWREDPERQTVEWWDKFFAYCAKSNFLTGRVPPRPGRTPFEVSLDWLVSPDNFVKVMEGTYER